MKIIKKKKKLKEILIKEKNLGFIPTMGALHPGHISLIKKSKEQCKKTIVSIYINKPQFNKKTDYNRYPKNLKKDINLLKKCNVNFLYLPYTKEIYPKGINKNIKINSFSKKLCGKFRPNHFKSVVDVVDRLIKIIKPKNIYFGEKDMQQLKLIENFIFLNKIKTNVIRCRTIREKNGIAYSSRNFLLSKKEKIIATNIYKYLKKSKKKIINKKIRIIKVKEKILNLGATRIDYLKLLNISKLIKPYKKNKEDRIFIAYYLGQTRLIDNF